MLRSSHSRAEAAAAPAAAGLARSARLVRTFAVWAQGGWQVAARAARLAIGIPDYEAYVSHLREHHPGRQPMERAAFYRDRMDARYGKGRARCC